MRTMLPHALTAACLLLALLPVASAIDDKGAVDEVTQKANDAIYESYVIESTVLGQAQGEAVWALQTAAPIALGLVAEALADELWAEQTALASQPCGYVPPLYLVAQCVAFVDGALP
jgi:hypothetical protein